RAGLPCPSPRAGASRRSRPPRTRSQAPIAAASFVPWSSDLLRQLDDTPQRQPLRQSSSAEWQSPRQPSKSRLSMHAFPQASRSSAHCLRHSSGTSAWTRGNPPNTARRVRAATIIVSFIAVPPARGRTEVGGVVPPGEPPRHGRGRRARLVAPPAVADEPGPARGGAQLEGARLLPPRDLEGVPERSLGGRLIALEP